MFRLKLIGDVKFPKAAQKTKFISHCCKVKSPLKDYGIHYMRSQMQFLLGYVLRGPDRSKLFDQKCFVYILKVIKNKEKNHRYAKQVKELNFHAR